MDPRWKSLLNTLSAALLFAVLLPACPEQPEETPPPARARSENEVARVALDGGGLQIRKAGENAFRAWDGTPLEQGDTVRTDLGIASLNFMGSVQVELSNGSELILEGLMQDARGPRLVLGLKTGEVRLNSSADCPIVLKMPHGEVSGTRAFFNAVLELDPDGAYSAVIKAFSPNILVKNQMGSLTLPSWGVLRADETTPPRLLRDLKRPGR